MSDATSAPASTPLEAVAERMAEVSPAWAAAVAAPDQSVPRVADERLLGRDRAQGVEAIREGWLLHRGQSRVAAAAGADLALLVGDWCYATGLCSIADHGTLDDVATLAELVADVSAAGAAPVVDLEPRWTTAIEALRHG